MLSKGRVMLCPQICPRLLAKHLPGEDGEAFYVGSGAGSAGRAERCGLGGFRLMPLCAV